MVERVFGSIFLRWMSICGLMVVLLLSLVRGKSLQAHDYSFDIGSQAAVGDQIQTPGTPPLISAPLAQFTPDIEKTALLNFSPVDSTDEEGLYNIGSYSMDALLNYLYTKHIQKMKQQIEASSLQQLRKRTNGNYYRMCAFNAVSCFG